MRRNTTRSASRFRHYHLLPAGEPFISKGTVEHSSNCEIYHFLSFWNSLSSAKLTYTQTLSTIYALTLVFNADISENTLPFVSQSINNFSDWECPSLSPHVLLLLQKPCCTSVRISCLSKGVFTWRKLALLVGPALLIAYPWSIVFLLSIYMVGRTPLAQEAPYQLGRVPLAVELSFCLFSAC